MQKGENVRRGENVGVSALYVPTIGDLRGVWDSSEREYPTFPENKVVKEAHIPACFPYFSQRCENSVIFLFPTLIPSSGQLFSF